MSKREEQMGALADRLREEGRLALADASNMLGVSESTVRRLFTNLERDGMAIRVHGGLALPTSGADYSYAEVENTRLNEKRRIARAALPELEGASSVYLDSGSTVCQLSTALAESAGGGRFSGLSVFTNSLANLSVLSGKLPVQLVGGAYRLHRRDFAGFIAEEALSRLHFDLCVMGADGLNVESGLTTTDFDTARLDSMVVERARRRIALVDADKFGRSAMVRYAPVSTFDAIYSDTSLPDEAAEQLARLGPRVERA